MPELKHNAAQRLLLCFKDVVFLLVFFTIKETEAIKTYTSIQCLLKIVSSSTLHGHTPSYMLNDDIPQIRNSSCRSFHPKCFKGSGAIVGKCKIGGVKSSCYGNCDADGRRNCNSVKSVTRKPVTPEDTLRLINRI
jgi:hypothetical protein